jgi:uncharacterized protein (TIGR02118 family)
MRELIVGVERQSGMDTEEFREYYREEHAPLVRDLPNLKEYQVTFAADPEKAPFDAVARLQFADAAAMGEALDSEAGEAMQADAANFADPESMLQFVGESRDLLDE